MDEAKISKLFKEAPIAVLEGYGLDVRTVNQMEEIRGWLYIGDLEGKRRHDIMSIPNLGERSYEKLKLAMNTFLARLREGDVSELI